MFYTVYKITNKINNKIYIGIHKTNNLNDNYFGSGKLILYAIKKYGKESFEKEILFTFSKLEEAKNKEKEIVDKIFINNESTYNIAIGGGLGGKELNGLTFSGRKHSAETKQKISQFMQGRKNHISPEGVERIKFKNKTNKVRNEKISNSLKGSKKTEEHKMKISNSLKNKKSPKKPYKRKYKQMWITDGINNTRIRLSDIIPHGWCKGRILK